MNSMSSNQFNPEQKNNSCESVRLEFSSYLDGAMTGAEMAAMAGHLDGCGECASEFTAWREIQQSLADLGPARPPMRLQERLRTAIAVERERGTHLPWTRRFLAAWEISIAPMALRVTGGFAAAIVLLGSLGWMLGAPISVQANDDEMAHLIAPRYLYSQVPPQPIETGREVPILVEAMVDTRGRVYDYSIIDGPRDLAVQLRVTQNLLSSVFKPATVFGVPVRGHVVMTYTGVSVRG
jgi:anti-sigma factor RsiW